MKIRILYVLVSLALFQLSLHAEGADFNDFLKGYSSIKSIKGTITQYIYTGSGIEKFSGDYSAIADGWFRIDYTYPERQVVINNSSGLYWYYPERELLFLKYRDEYDSGIISSLPGNPLMKSFEKIDVVYEGLRFYGIFRYAHVYSFKSGEDGNSVHIWFEPHRRFMVRRYITDKSGRELMKEIYHEHVEVEEACIPSVIELFIRSNNGPIHTITKYNSVVVNKYPDKKLFDFAIKKNMTIRGFNEIEK